MKEFVKELGNDLRMPSLTMKERVVMWYFIISFCLLFIGDESPVWAVAVVVLNFGNAARLVRKIDFNGVEEFEDIKDFKEVRL